MTVLQPTIIDLSPHEAKTLLEAILRQTHTPETIRDVWRILVGAAEIVPAGAARGQKIGVLADDIGRAYRLFRPYLADQLHGDRL